MFFLLKYILVAVGFWLVYDECYGYFCFLKQFQKRRRTIYDKNFENIIISMKNKKIQALCLIEHVKLYASMNLKHPFKGSSFKKIKRHRIVMVL